MKSAELLFLFASLAGAAFGADYPEAEISNGMVKANLLLPDARTGYYRGTRFDWSGAISSLQAGGHEYFGKWFDRYDAQIHDAIMGPVEEFLTNGSGLGYAEAKPGQSFVKIGVGAIRKPDEAKFQQFQTYEIASGGHWSIHQEPDWVSFTQELPDTLGYAYVYTKTVRLTPGKQQLVLEHSLRNTGRKTIETSVYEHNFYMLDHQASGPDFVVRFPFAVSATADLHGAAETRGKEFTYLRELREGEAVYTLLTGYGSSPGDYDIRVENRKSKAGVRQTSDRPLAKLVLWSIRTTVCPEAFIDLTVAPGEEQKWKIVYDFYALP